MLNCLNGVSFEWQFFPKFYVASNVSISLVTHSSIVWNRAGSQSKACTVLDTLTHKTISDIKQLNGHFFEVVFTEFNLFSFFFIQTLAQIRASKTACHRGSTPCAHFKIFFRCSLLTFTISVHSRCSPKAPNISTPPFSMHSSSNGLNLSGKYRGPSVHPVSYPQITGNTFREAEL